MADVSPLVKALSSGDVNAAMPEAYMNPDVGPGGSIARMIQGLMTLPQRAIQNSQYSLDSGTYDPKVPLETVMTVMGAGAGGAPAAMGEQLLGSGLIRKIPTDNYLGPVSRYTKSLYREMSPGEALPDLPTSVAYSSGGFGGAPRRFYAEQPEMALGQGGNKGVRVHYDSEPFEGTINQNKPAWQHGFQNGNAEYVAAPRVDANIRDAVRGVEIDPSSLSRVEAAQYQRILNNLEQRGWNVNRATGKITATRPE